MSVIIHNLEMPKDCMECPCHNGENGRCQILDMVTDYIPRFCPMEEIIELKTKTGEKKYVHNQY